MDECTCSVASVRDASLDETVLFLQRKKRIVHCEGGRKGGKNDKRHEENESSIVKGGLRVYTITCQT